jgi:hypothetical protein
MIATQDMKLPNQVDTVNPVETTLLEDLARIFECRDGKCSSTRSRSPGDRSSLATAVSTGFMTMPTAMTVMAIAMAVATAPQRARTAPRPVRLSSHASFRFGSEAAEFRRAASV